MVGSTLLCYDGIAEEWGAWCFLEIACGGGGAVR